MKKPGQKDTRQSWTKENMKRKNLNTDEKIEREKNTRKKEKMSVSVLMGVMDMEVESHQPNKTLPTKQRTSECSGCQTQDPHLPLG